MSSVFNEKHEDSADVMCSRIYWLQLKF